LDVRTLQSFWKHSDTVVPAEVRTAGMRALPNIFVFQILLPLVSPVLDLLFLGSLVLWGLPGCTSRRSRICDNGRRAAFGGVFPGIFAD